MKQISKKKVIKIIVAGEGGVGKTTLLHRYIDRKFYKDTSMTVGLEFFLIDHIVDEENYVLQVWDLGGQERFQFLHDKFSSGSRGALLLFDLTSNRSFERIDGWINILEVYNQKVPILLVGCKLDLIDEIAVDDDRILGRRKRYGFIDFIKTSAKTGENVENIFDRLVSKILKIQD